MWKAVQQKQQFKYALNLLTLVNARCFLIVFWRFIGVVLGTCTICVGVCYVHLCLCRPNHIWSLHVRTSAVKVLGYGRLHLLVQFEVGLQGQVFSDRVRCGNGVYLFAFRNVWNEFWMRTLSTLNLNDRKLVPRCFRCVFGTFFLSWESDSLPNRIRRRKMFVHLKFYFVSFSKRPLIISCGIGWVIVDDAWLTFQPEFACLQMAEH